MSNCKDVWHSAISEWIQEGDYPPWLQEVQSYIDDGINIDPTPPPPSNHYQNSSLVRIHAHECKERIDYYKDLGAITNVSDQDSSPWTQPLLAIRKDSKKTRLVLDLSRNLNDFIPNIPLKYQSVHTAVRKSRHGVFYTKIDLSACFLSFNVSKTAQRFLQFNFQGQRMGYTRMPFGLKPAPAICQRLLAVVSRILHRCGVVHVRYLDDFLFISDSEAAAHRDLATARAVFSRFGLAVNPQKTESPTTRVEFLGIIIDSLKETLECSTSRLQETCSILRRLSVAKSLRFKEIQSVLGKFNFVSQVMKYARPFFRKLTDCLTGNGRIRQRKVRVSKTVRDDAKYWLSHIRQWNGCCSWRTKRHLTFVTDASTSGFGFRLTRESTAPGHIADPLPPHLAVGQATVGIFSFGHLVKIAKEHCIQWAELYSIAMAVSLYAPCVDNTRLHFHCDNKTDCHILNRLSTRSADLLLLLRAMTSTLAGKNLTISCSHIAGDLNTDADTLSRPAKHKFCLAPTETLRFSRQIALSQAITEAPLTSQLQNWWIPSAHGLSDLVHERRTRPNSADISSSVKNTAIPR